MRGFGGINAARTQKMTGHLNKYSMNYLIFAKYSLANERNHAMAIACGAGGSQDTTQLWWDIIDHPTNGRCAVVIRECDVVSFD